MTVTVHTGPAPDGDVLHTVHRCQPCPECGHPGPLHVQTAAVAWACGHWRDLPPLPQQAPPTGARAQSRARIQAHAAGDHSLCHPQRRCPGTTGRHR